MENDSLSSPSSSESKLPLIVGIVRFALGAAGLVLGLKAKSAADAAQAAATAAQTATAQVQGRDVRQVGVGNQELCERRERCEN